MPCGRSLVPSLVLSLTLAAAGFAAAGGVAHAQPNEDRRMWLQMLTTPPEPQRAEPAPRRARSTSNPARQRQTVETPEAAPALDVPVTHRVVVFGDSLATNLGEGLVEVLSDQPQIAAATRSRGSSGLVRDDYYDWSAEIEPFFQGEEAVDIGVVLIGINDRQDLTRDGETLPRLSEPWREAYGQRVDRILERFARAGVPLVWVGLPPPSSPRLAEDFLVINEIVRGRVANARGAIYVDIWEAFLDGENRYSATGPTLEGQIARLRAGDGIHFTPPGARKVAHFVDVEIGRIVADEPAIARPDLSVDPSIEDHDFSARDLEGLSADEIVSLLNRLGATRDVPAPAERVPEPVVGRVVPLTGVERAPGAELANGRPLAERSTRLFNERVLADGIAPPPVPGRADDFSWPPPTLTPIASDPPG